MNAPVLPVLGIVGASGRLGSSLCAAAAAGGRWQIGLRASRECWVMDERPDVLVDASRRSALAEVVAFCARYRVPLVSATSGLEGQDERLQQLAGTVPVIRAANLSYGHHLQRELVSRLAALVSAEGGAVDVTVHERHPSTKADSPSATARALVDLWHAASSVGLASIDSLRAGAPVSDHSITLGFGGEDLTITHSVRSLAVPARRALEAASWAITASPGLYTMADMYRANASRLSTDETGSNECLR